MRATLAVLLAGSAVNAAAPAGPAPAGWPVPGGPGPPAPLGCAQAEGAAHDPMRLVACARGIDLPLRLGAAGPDVPTTRLARPGAIACASIEPFDGKCESWAQAWNDGRVGGFSQQYLGGLAVSGAGDRVFITGTSVAQSGDGAVQGFVDWATVAYDATTGAQRWAATLDTDGLWDAAWGIAASPDGRLVFVTGYTACCTGPNRVNSMMSTVAYDAADGSVVWRRDVDWPAGGFDEGTALAVSADGSVLVVAGTADMGAFNYDYALLGYEARTGRHLWTGGYASPSTFDTDVPLAVELSDDGRIAYVTGITGERRSGIDGYFDYGTAAFAAHGEEAGTRLWVARYDGPKDNDWALDLSVAPGGTDVFVTGFSWSNAPCGAVCPVDIATVAYGPGGSTLWAQRYAGRSGGLNAGRAVAATPDRVVVAGLGSGEGNEVNWDAATVSYDRATGSVQWNGAYPFAHMDYEDAFAITASPDGARFYVSGYSGTDLRGGLGWQPTDQLTLAYNADGTVAWAARFNSDVAGRDADVGVHVALHPGTARLFTAGVIARESAPLSERALLDYGLTAYEI